MTPLVSTATWMPSADPAFEMLVDRLIARLQAGEKLDWSIVVREHPEHADRLQSMADALEALADLSAAADPNPSDIAPGSREMGFDPGVLGDFQILREVGRGGMAVVYEAEQVSLNRRVALKVLPLAATMDPRQLQRFRHEARAAGLLHHPHIVPVHGVGCERGVHYYAMQLIEGCSLAAVIGEWRKERRNPKSAALASDPALAGGEETQPEAARATVPSDRARIPYRRIAELVVQAADALEYAHTMGVVHRDVKPANLLLDAGGNVWVTDFGLARLGAGPGLTASGDLLGTLRYMSPEQALARHGLVDHRTDIYSLGATLYELLTLQPAVDGTSKEEVLHRLSFEEPIPLRKLDRSIPAELETVTLKALAKSPEERYSTARELAEDLRRWLTDRPIQVRPPRLVHRLRKWSYRHRPVLAVLGAALILVVAALSLGAVAYGVKQRELANDRSRFADEKEHSERMIAEQLRQVLVDRAEAIRVARPPGYRRRVWADLHQATALPGGEGGVDQLRATVLKCLGDPVGLEPVEDPKTVTRRTHPDLAAELKERVGKAADGSPVAASPDGEVVAVTARDRRSVEINRRGKPIRREESSLGAVYDLALAADANALAAGCEQGFVAWDLTGPDRWVVRAGNVFSVAITPDRRLLAVGGRQLELWSLTTKRLIASWPAPLAGARVEFSADGGVLLAVVNGEPVAGWPVSDTPERRAIHGHALGVPAAAFSPDSRQLVSVSKDRTVRVWDAGTGGPVHVLTGHAGEIEAVAFNPDGSLLATGDLAGSIRVWDPHSGKLLGEVGQRGELGQVWRLQFGPGGEYLAAAGRHVAAWTVRVAHGRVALERLCTLAAPPGSPDVIDLAVRPGGPELIFLNRGGRLYSYDLARADETRLLTDALSVLRSLHFTPTGDRLTFVSPGGALRLWDWEAKAAEEAHRHAEAVALSADGRWSAIVAPGQSVTIAELASGREVLTLPPEGSDVWCVAWSPDGTKLAVGLSDGGVAVWDLQQVRARLAEFGLASPSTDSVRSTPASAPVPAFDRVVRVNRMRADAERARRLAKEAGDAGDPSAERDHLVATLNLDEQLAEVVPDAPGHRKRLAWTHGALGRALARLGKIDSALQHIDRESALLLQLLVEHPGNAEYRRLLAAQRTGRSKALGQAGKFEEAVSDARRAVADREELAANPGKPLDREQLAVAYHNLGFELAVAGQRTEAERWYLAALAAQDRLAADFSQAADTQAFRAGRGATLNNLGILLARTDRGGAAEKRFHEAAAIRTRLANEFPANPDYASDLGRTLEWLGGMLRDRQQFAEAVRTFGEAVQRQRAALELRPKNAVFRELCWKHQSQLAHTLLLMSRVVETADAPHEVNAPKN
jgi:serine/threonine protein kinase/WD40 repeat protein